MRRPPVALAVALVLAGCGGGQTVTPAPETVEGTIPQGTTTQQAKLPKGNADAGKEVFTSIAQPPCGQCHTYQAAGTTGTLGPDLDEALQGRDAAFILESIVNPSAQIASGFTDIMPKDYGEKLSEKQLADLVAFLEPKS